MHYPWWMWISLGRRDTGSGRYYDNTHTSVADSTHPCLSLPPSLPPILRPQVHKRHSHASQPMSCRRRPQAHMGYNDRADRLEQLCEARRWDGAGRPRCRPVPTQIHRVLCTGEAGGERPHGAGELLDSLCCAGLLNY